MTTRRNDFRGQTLGGTVSAVNSSASGDAFTTVSPGTGTVQYVADPAGGARIAIKLTPGSAASCYVRDASFNSTTISLSDCFYYSGAPSGDAPVHAVMVGATSCASVSIRSTGYVVLKGAGGTILATDTVALTPGHWYRFETQVLSDASAGTVSTQWYIDDGTTMTRSLSTTGKNTRGGAITTVDRGVADSAASGYLPAWTYSRLQAIDGTTAPLGAWPSNFPPDAAAGRNQTVEPYALCTLDGTKSSDSDGDTITYAWTQTAGVAVTLSSATVAKPTFTAPATLAGDTLTFRLKVNDGKVDSAPSTVDITVPPHTIWRITNPTGPVLAPIRLTIAE